MSLPKKRKHRSMDSTSAGPEDAPRQPDRGSNNGTDDIPACLSCRKRKAKCSRSQPCDQCVRLGAECIYAEHRQRPGLRPGAVEGLSQRVNALEQMLLGQGLLLKAVLGGTNASNGRHNGVVSGSPENEQPENSMAAEQEAVRSLLMAAGGHETNGHRPVHTASLAGPSHVPDGDEQDPATWTRSNQHEPTDTITLPPKTDLDRLLRIYFDQVHRWIPVLHEQSFLAVCETERRTQYETILHAITSVCLRLDNHQDDGDGTGNGWPGTVPTVAPAWADRYKRHRNHVILQSMEAFSVANLQALVIVAFDIIGGGGSPSAWSVIGSMARTAEQLQLSVETTGQLGRSQDHPFLRRIAFLQPPSSFVEEEERRRVFWAIFSLDRLCSIATGWNNSLTAADIHRRLPCEGALWARGDQVETPFFGMAERESTAAYGSLAPEYRPGSLLESVGGFAYSIEAMESLNLVTTFFLRQPLNFSNQNEVHLWLVRFKELDLRLLKWRSYLPPKWADAVAPDIAGGMDPNLALAHILHNTAVVQLHQAIAYSWKLQPPAGTTDVQKSSSAQTCMAAAFQISSIAGEFLQRSSGLVSAHFSLCLFIAGRVLLAHSKHTNTAIDPQFFEILKSLDEASIRWDASATSAAASRNVAQRFSRRLKVEQQRTMVDTNKPVYSEDAETRPSTPSPFANVLACDFAFDDLTSHHVDSDMPAWFFDFHGDLSTFSQPGRNPTTNAHPDPGTSDLGAIVQ